MAENRVTRQALLEATPGMLHKQLYVISTTPTRDMGPVLESLPAHLEHQRSLEQRGIMFAAGPHLTDDEQTWEGDGMFVIRAGSLAEARQIAASDPMHTSGARSFTVRPWLINEGGFTLRVTFSDGKLEVR